MENYKKDYFNNAIRSKHWENRQSPALEYLDFLKTLDKYPEGKKLVDVGCASGIEVGEFQKLGLKADGVDVSEEFIKEAQENFPDSHFVAAKAEELPFKKGSYDIVFSINTLFHTDIEKSIPEFCRVLNEAGRGIVSFDIEIVNLDEDKIIHSDSIEHLEEILDKSGAEIEKLGMKEERIDVEPFRHKHVFHKIIFKKQLKK